MRALIDADTIAFACAASAEGQHLFVAESRASEMVENILGAVGADEYELWLTGKGNFRYSVYPEYKANRIDTYRPTWEKEVKDFLTKEWQANWTVGIEADDMIGVRNSELEYQATLCHIDKDLNQLPGRHYNWELRRLGNVIREARQYSVTLEEGNRYFYYQLLIGDTTDNIKGAVGIGPKKASALLDSLDKSEWFEGVLDCFSCKEELDLNAQCIYIWRKQNDNWKNLLTQEQRQLMSSNEVTTDFQTDGQKED